MTRSKKLVRTSSDQWIAGVCGGIARYLGVDPTVVRLAFVVLTVLGLGSMIIVYLVAWLLMPKDV
ncbi:MULTISPECIES: PspC domain-containing protein [Mumia]|uniref:PspC domain-containing protein n=1 Tax=Mumia TaxID=1546255 RepID=UPI00141E4F1E|nr:MULTISPECIES: PspC domain-containing protein [unclassified Mumia]QMW65686.1 PspC domain-containing protein [Mumia sp. ZJ1417]